MKRKRKSRNLWKVFFFVLIGLNVAFVTAVLAMVGIPQDVALPDTPNINKEETTLLVQSNKENLNKIISRSIEETQTDDTLDYRVVLTDHVEVYTKFPIFDNHIQLKMTFTPIPLDNGDLILKQQTMELGNMMLPVSYVLNFIKKEDNLPKWMIINPKKEQIYISLNEIHTFGDMKLRVKEFDLEKDEIAFRLVIPE